jgi:hypothetical protein
MEMRAQTYVLITERDGMKYAAVAVCEPTSEGFEMKMLVRCPLPRNQVPIVVLEEIEEWLEEIRRGFHQYHLMCLP